MVARKESSSVVKDFHHHRDVSAAGAVVDQCFAFTLGVPGSHRKSAALQFKSCGHAVHRLVAIILGVLPVGMKINNPGRDDQPGGVDDRLAVHGVGGDGNNLLVLNGDVADRVEAGFGIHDAAVVDDQVVLLSGCGNGDAYGEH
jgi:hypothetical protein